jgi:hypothetical protein
MIATWIIIVLMLAVPIAILPDLSICTAKSLSAGIIEYKCPAIMSLKQP